IAFTGMPWAGKTEAVSIAREMGLPVIRMGDLVWEEVEKQGLEVNSENVARIAEEMRKQYGRDIWAKKTMEKIQKEEIGETAVVIDGIRSIEEVDCFKSYFKQDFIIVAITASDEIRRNRAIKRGRKDDTTNLEEIIRREEREKKWGLPRVIQEADYTIPNEGSLELFKEEMRKLLQEILSKR
ncbi:MAG TPA: flagellar hook-basal body complex protein FliE, partial [Thermoplasmatales archaeon]|nr:flagellar hook-basal body complex protein FliE [Thermoplasmatales archaeon]